MMSLSLLLAISAASSNCCAQINFQGDCDMSIADLGLPRACNPLNHDQESNDFNDSNNWWFGNTSGLFPNPDEIFYLQNYRTAIFSSGNTTLGELIVSNDSPGRLIMTGGSLTLLNDDHPLELGREQEQKPWNGDYNKNGVVDGADFLVWQRTLGQEVLNEGDGADGDESGFIDPGDLDFWQARFGLITRGGEVILSGASILTSKGVVAGRRTKGLLSVGPDALLDIKGPIFNGSSTFRSEDLEVGSYGESFHNFVTEPGLRGDGLVIVEGTMNANDLTVNVFGSKGEFRLLPGGRVNLNGSLVLSHCDTQFFGSSCGLRSDVDPQTLMSSKLSIIGSGGTFNVGEYDPDLSPLPGHDPDMRHDIHSEWPANATMSFTTDAGGVTPIVLVDNSIPFPGELTGTAYLDGTVGNVAGTYAAINLELDLDAYTGTSPLTLIDAPPGHLSGVFNPAVTFLGTTTATVNYDYENGDVFLSNFQNGAGAGTGSLTQVPEPSGLALMTLTLALCCCFHAARRRNGSRSGRHGSRGKSLI
jgi:hypothetical protein